VFFPVGSDVVIGLSLNQISALFGVDGFANSALAARDVKYKFDFKASEVKRRANPAPQYYLLVAPLPVSPGDQNRIGQINPTLRPPTIQALEGGIYYPWLYDSASTNRFNPDGFDLWTEVLIGKKIMRFSNWEARPVVIGNAP
jgi:hypothetical protein